MLRFIFNNYLIENKLATTGIIDLKAYNFPIFEITLKTMNNPARNLLEYAERIKSSDGIIIVTPEYNGGYPASLKKAIRLAVRRIETRTHWYSHSLGVYVWRSTVHGSASIYILENDGLNHSGYVFCSNST